MLFNSTLSIEFVYVILEGIVKLSKMSLGGPQSEEGENDKNEMVENENSFAEFRSKKGTNLTNNFDEARKRRGSNANITADAAQ